MDVSASYHVAAQPHLFRKAIGQASQPLIVPATVTDATGADWPMVYTIFAYIRCAVPFAEFPGSREGLCTQLL
jgi:hypothetical protein